MNLLKKYERHLSGLAFIVGFMFDYLFTPRIDNPYTPFILGGYLGLAGITILLGQLFWRMAARRPSLLRFEHILPTITQLIFGAMMSMLFVYYLRSATLAGSWPFMLLLGGMFIGNELFRDRVRLFKFQLTSFFFVFFMVMVICIPVALRTLGVIPFLIAGATSLFGTIMLIGIIFSFSQKIVRENVFGMFILIGTTYLLINLLYFTHLIPPIPLSLPSSGIYHSLSRDQHGDYVGFGEHVSWTEQYGLQKKVLHLFNGEPAYFYSAVFAPIAITTPIVHEWEYRDEGAGEWHTVHRVSFPIMGGRDEGYRGYSIKESVIPGKWRVSVKTASGVLLGRSSFRVVRSESLVSLEQTLLQ